ncbi:MAG: toxin-antitoxin system HicB family antitoxin, partial [Planctomycetaceae bacterium]
VTRISPDLHLQVKVAAVLSGNSLNAWVAEQLAGAVLRIGAVQAAGTKKRSVTAAKRKTKAVIRKSAPRQRKRNEQHA